MKDHILVVHEGKGFDCQFCNRTFNSILTMQSHIRNIHKGRKPKPEKCSQCDKIFVNAGTLRKHTEAVHEKKRPYACHLCDLSFTQSGNLKTHIKGKHKEFIFTGKIKNGSFLPG
jgi:glass-like protein